MLTAVYAGTFDPVTYGHLDIISRAAAVYGRVVVATTENVSKRPLFSVEERLEQLRLTLDGQANVELASFSGLLVDFARAVGARIIVRGLRAASDFDYEFEMALMNRSLAPEVETSFFVASPEYTFVSSSMIKEVARNGGDVSRFVPPNIQNAIMQRLGQHTAGRDTAGL
jgi:pantetheine-phosphate adenylyltransferase